MWDKIETLYYNIIYGVRNIIKWFPVIWRDRNWDSHFIYNILLVKFENMEYVLGNSPFISDKTLKDIRLAKLLTKRLSEDKYFDNNRNYIFDKYSNSKYMEKQDREYLFKHLSKHIHKWWD